MTKFKKINLMWILTILTVTVTLSAMGSIKKIVRGKEKGKLETLGLEEFILTEADVPGWKLKTQTGHTWSIRPVKKVKEYEETKKYYLYKEIEQKRGITQTWLTPSESYIRYSYCMFDSPQEAVEAATFHSLSMAVLFKEGSITGKKVGDKSWITIEKEVAVLFIWRNIAVLIGGSGWYDKHEPDFIEKLALELIRKFESVD